MVAASHQPPRREELLEFIIELTVRDGQSPNVPQLAQALGVGETRIRQLLDQLVALGKILKRPGAAHGLVVLDPDGRRRIAVARLHEAGWKVPADIEGCAYPQLPVLNAIEHLAGVTWPEL